MSWFSKIFSGRSKKTAPPPGVTARVTIDDTYNTPDWIPGQRAELYWLQAKYPYEWLLMIDLMYLYDPNLKKHLQTTISLGNPGHNVEIDTADPGMAKDAIDLCNDLAARCFPYASGANGFINGLMSQSARSGGMCAEWVPLSDYSGIQRAYLVPVRTLRFRRNPDYTLEMGQLQWGKFVPLNLLQVPFSAVWIEDGNPYPIPPCLAVIQRLGMHKKIIQKIEDWFNKLAAMGFLTLKFERPENLGEDPETYRAKAKAALDDLAKGVKDNLTSGIVLGFDDMEATFNNTNAGAAGAKQIAQMLDEDLFAGLGRDPVMFGRSFTKNDSWATIIYEELVSEIRNIQFSAASILEHGYRLNLVLNGLINLGINVKFNPLRSLDAFRDGEAEMMIANKIFGAYDRQLIDGDKALRLLGYASSSPNAGKFIAAFDNGKYHMERVPGPSFAVPSFQMELARSEFTEWPMINGPIADDAPRSIREQARKYLGEIESILRVAGRIGVEAVYEWARKHNIDYVDEFVAEVMALFIEATEAAIDASEVAQIAKKHLTPIWKGAKADSRNYGAGYQPGIGTSFQQPDRAAINYMGERVDQMYVSRFVSNSPARSKQIQGWIRNQYLEKGLGIGKTPKQLDKFKAEFGDITENLSSHAARIIVDTSVQRARNWSAVYGLFDEGFEEFVIGGPIDKIACRYCKSMVGRTFTVKTERTRIERIVENGDEDIAKFAPFLTKRYGTSDGFKELKSATDEQIQKGGMVTPPFHPLCRHYIVANI